MVNLFVVIYLLSMLGDKSRSETLLRAKTSIHDDKTQQKKNKTFKMAAVGTREEDEIKNYVMKHDGCCV